LRASVVCYSKHKQFLDVSMLHVASNTHTHTHSAAVCGDSIQAQINSAIAMQYVATKEKLTNVQDSLCEFW